MQIAFRRKLLMAGAYASMIGATVAYLFLPKFFGQAIDTVKAMLDGGEFSSATVLTIVGFIFVLSVIRGVLSFFQTYFGEAASQYVSYDLRNTLYDHLQHLGFGFHDTHHTGSLMSRAITDVENIRMFVNMGIVRTPYFIALFIVVAIILLRMDWRLGLVAVSFMPFVAIQSGFARLRMRKAWLVIQDMMAELNTVLQENLTGQRVVKAFASEEFEEQKYNDKSRDVSGAVIMAERLRVSNTAFTLFSFQVALALILWFGGSRVINGDMTIGQLAAFVFYMQILAMPVRMSGMIVNAYARAASAGQRLFEILDLEAEQEEAPGARVLSDVKGYVKFENVSFSYDEGVPVLKNINIEAEPGKIVALLGAPGSGKSTIINLLPRFYDADSGRITIDGIDIKDVTLKSLRHSIGMVQQDVFLFTTSLEDNIAYGKEDASFDEVVRAAGIAQLDEHITSLNDGYDTVVGERGSTLSGGQRQRMSIARAVLLDPPILILDDSTSSVDAGTEEEIRLAMEEVMAGRTTFIIAHRLSTVHRADEIIVLDHGEIVERGTHQELLAKNGKYRDIYELQLRPQEEVLRDMDVDAEGHVIASGRASR
ncbi:MAG: ABC transporter ATP-binding protein [Chloroflexi bacterium]|nr:ABC transporter ATP-binding protein [Chloroflexota bacterium]MCI0791106.1 ABC transporter ATP-binding protein [Chloroflexota bacterium]MCI0812635.1 ABC transporter ATP-binding protein [Chloroflexota bacterium]MCI0822293.1 ABC transporter ATP-binding protein [Chloroflexota bacterium]MCI0868710.1 ABC transporter ATP-binding protein [Chloroflexota bacterium]